jgi:transcriptional regulator of arginine metabolism
MQVLCIERWQLMMNKEARQRKILSLIRATPIATQDELKSHLERAGVPATQSSVSRDLEEMGVVKQHGRYMVPNSNGAAAHGLLRLDPAGEVLVVARTEPGLASAVAVQIDGAVIPEIIGTLAGEDTIFIAVNDRRTQRTAIKKIWGIFE